MANSSVVRGGYFTVVLNSDDPSNQIVQSNGKKNNVQFFNTLATPIVFPDNELASWQCCLKAASFYMPYGPAIYVTTPIIQPTIVGSAKFSVLHQFPASELGIWPYLFEQMSTVQQWQPLSAARIDRIAISLANIVNNQISEIVPNVFGNTPTVLELAFKRIGQEI